MNNFCNMAKFRRSRSPPIVNTFCYLRGCIGLKMASNEIFIFLLFNLFL